MKYHSESNETSSFFLTNEVSPRKQWNHSFCPTNECQPDSNDIEKYFSPDNLFLTNY